MKLPQADMFADDIYGNPTEWYSKESVTQILESERAKIREEVESVIDDYCIDGEWQLNQVLGRVEKELLAKLTPDKTNNV